MAGYGEGQGGSTSRTREDFPELLTIRLQEALGFYDLMTGCSLHVGTVHIWRIRRLARCLFRGGLG